MYRIHGHFNAVVSPYELPPTSSVPPTVLDELRESAAHTAGSGEPDREALTRLRHSGLLAVGVPVEYGGTGGGALVVNRTVEAVATANPSLAIMLFQHCEVTARIAEWGAESQKSALLPALADGDLLAANAWSEPAVGAVPNVLGTTGKRRPGGGWLLNGAKSFTTSASVADLYLVLVQTSRSKDDQQSAYGSTGQSFFLVSGDNPGLVPDLSPDLEGMRGSVTGFVSLEDCVARDMDRLGPLGRAPDVIAGARETGATLGAVSVGIGQAALDLAMRHAGNAGLLSARAMRHRLVEIGAQVEAARAMVELAGVRTSADPGATTLRSKIFASAVAEQTGVEVARMLSSAGYVAGNRINQLIADARAVALMGPADDLCRELVAEPWSA